MGIKNYVKGTREDPGRHKIESNIYQPPWCARSCVDCLALAGFYDPMFDPNPPCLSTFMPALKCHSTTIFWLGMWVFHQRHCR